MTTDVQQGALRERVGAVRPLPHMTECAVHLEDRYTGYTASIVLRMEHAAPDLPAGSVEAVLYRDQALSLAAALIGAVREQCEGDNKW